MKKVESPQYMYQNLSNLKSDCFAHGIFADYRTDWALADNYQPEETTLNTTQRNLG